MDEVVRTSGLTKRFDDVTAVDGIDLVVRAGERVGLLGPNGAGKTTTLKLLMGLTFPSAGSARILGKDWRDPEIKKRVGFLPEQPYFYNHLTPRELLDHYGRLSGLSAQERKLRIPKMIDRVGLTDSLEPYGVTVSLKSNQAERRTSVEL